MNQEHKNLWRDVLLAGIRTGMKIDKAVTYADAAVSAYRELDEVATSIPWHEAPEWAEWAAMDDGCSWYWYETKPNIVGSGEWNNVGDAQEFLYTPSFSGDWKDSLQRRPK